MTYEAHMSPVCRICGLKTTRTKALGFTQLVHGHKGVCYRWVDIEPQFFSPIPDPRFSSTQLPRLLHPNTSRTQHPTLYIIMSEATAHTRFISVVNSATGLSPISTRRVPVPTHKPREPHGVLIVLSSEDDDEDTATPGNEYLSIFYLYQPLTQ